MGEHAVVYGRPALAAAVDLRLTVHVSARTAGTDDAVRLDLPSLTHAEDLSWSAVRGYAQAARESWREYSRQPAPERFRAVRGDDPAHIVKAALGEAAAFLAEHSAETDLPGGDLPGIELRVESCLPIGSGFGSSAAASVRAIAGYLSFRGAFRGMAGDLETIERLSLEAERRQHGLPSGIDTATVLQGGLLWARRLPSGRLETERAVLRSSLLSNLRVYDTGTPAEPTGAVVAAVRGRRDADPARHEALLNRIEAAVRTCRHELAREGENPARIVQMLRDCEACLEELGVVPEAVRVIVRKIEAEGGAAKISGAGSLTGPGAGSLLVYHPQPEKISRWPFLQPFHYHPVHLGADGLRLETDA
jgi:mevalonate kinase